MPDLSQILLLVPSKVTVWRCAGDTKAVGNTFGNAWRISISHAPTGENYYGLLWSLIYPLTQETLKCLHGVCMKDDTYHNVLGRLGAWLPARTGCTSPGRSRPVRDTDQILACLYMEDTTRRVTSQEEAHKIDMYSSGSSVKSTIWVVLQTPIIHYLNTMSGKNLNNTMIFL